jgi:hypothetical protein
MPDELRWKNASQPGRKAHYNTRMYTTMLYGFRVESDILLQRLKGHELSLEGVACMDGPSLSLKRSGSGQQPDIGTMAVPLQNSHGRRTTIHVDTASQEMEPGKKWSFNVENVVRFYGTGGSGLVTYSMAPLARPEQVAFWFIHTLLPFYLSAEQGLCFLHAAAIENGEKALVFLARSGGGKSTIVEYFLRRGHALISDDKLGILRRQGSHFALPSHSRHRPYRRQEDLGFEATSFCSSLRQIQSMYFLEQVDADDAVAVCPVTGLERLQRLIPAKLFGLKSRQAEMLEVLAKAADQIPMFVLEIPWTRDRLEDVYFAVTEK